MTQERPINPNGILPAGSLQQNFPHQNRVRVPTRTPRKRSVPLLKSVEYGRPIQPVRGRQVVRFYLGLLGIPNLCSSHMVAAGSCRRKRLGPLGRAENAGSPPRRSLTQRGQFHHPATGGNLSTQHDRSNSLSVGLCGQCGQSRDTRKTPSRLALSVGRRTMVRGAEHGLDAVRKVVTSRIVSCRLLQRHTNSVIRRA
jgi:hypothetical protein